MESEEAKRRLDLQIRELTEDHFNTGHWIQSTTTMIRDVFPISHPQKAKFINGNLFFADHKLSHYRNQGNFLGNGLEQNPMPGFVRRDQPYEFIGVTKATELLNSWIRDIEKFGMEQEQSPNQQQIAPLQTVTNQLGRTWADNFYIIFLNRNLKRWTIWLIVVVIVAALLIYILSYITPIRIQLYKGTFDSSIDSLIKPK